LGQALIVLIRLAAGPLILRWPLGGALLCIALDALDVVLIELIGLGGFSNYAALDKALDMYYLSFALLVTLRWEPVARGIAVGLFAWRLLGIALFEITQVRVLLLVFPNVFENFYIAYLALRRFVPRFELTPLRLALLVVLVTIPKLAQEWLLHYQEAQPWDWIKRNILRDSWRF
jgi:hypothetical protein